MILYSNLCETLSRPPNKQPRCFARSVEDLQYTLADFPLMIVDCLDSCKENNWDTSAKRIKSENNCVA